mgnify:CR=1 FL=1
MASYLPVVVVAAIGSVAAFYLSDKVNLYNLAWLKNFIRIMALFFMATIALIVAPESLNTLFLGLWGIVLVFFGISLILLAIETMRSVLKKSGTRM